MGLDQSIYGADDDDDIGGKAGVGGAGGASSAAGKPSVAGSTSPSGGSSGLNPGAAVAPCNSYCPGYATQCAERLNGQNCEAACQAEINGFGVRCQQLGIQALGCLKPFFTVGGRNCDAAVNNALQTCGKIVADFQTCKGVTTPTPTMPTMPTTPKDVTQCGSSGSASPNSCQTTYVCPSGKFQVACMISGDGTATCGCLSANGGMAGGTVPNSDPCTLAARQFCFP